MKGKAKYYVGSSLLIIFSFLLGIVYSRQGRPPQEKRPIETAPEVVKLLNLKDGFMDRSSLEAVDVNGDGAEEIIYRSQGASWSHLTSILTRGENAQLVLFCDSCTFQDYSGFVEFDDLNNDGVQEVIVNTAWEEVKDSDGQIDYEKSIIPEVVYYYNGKDYIKR